jgi:hypothetical protein
MGVGTSAMSDKGGDIMESFIVPEQNSYAVQYRNRVYTHVLHHRELLGYPTGCNNVPYMFVSNDLSGIFIEFIRLFKPYKDNDTIQDVKKDFINILNLLILSYEDPSPYYHSTEKDVFLAMHKALVELS